MFDDIWYVLIIYYLIIYHYNILSSDYLWLSYPIVLREEAIKKAELLFQALDADGDGSLTQVRSLYHPGHPGKILMDHFISK